MYNPRNGKFYPRQQLDNLSDSDYLVNYLARIITQQNDQHLQDMIDQSFKQSSQWQVMCHLVSLTVIYTDPMTHQEYVKYYYISVHDLHQTSLQLKATRVKIVSDLLEAFKYQFKVQLLPIYLIPLNPSLGKEIVHAVAYDKLTGTWSQAMHYNSLSLIMPPSYKVRSHTLLVEQGDNPIEQSFIYDLLFSQSLARICQVWRSLYNYIDNPRQLKEQLSRPFPQTAWSVLLEEK